MNPLESMQASLLSLLAGRRGHFLTESGYHSECWYDLDALLARHDLLQPFIVELARQLGQLKVEAVCGPMTGGAQLAAKIAAILGVASHHSDRFPVHGATGLFPVSYQIPAEDREKLRGKTVAIVDDAISAGSAVKGTFADLLACGARPVALGALFVFGDAGDHFAAAQHLPLVGIARQQYGLWLPGECPLCRAKVPLEPVFSVPPADPA